MPLPSTMTPIATVTLSADQSTVTFSSIPSNYTDLRLVIQARVASASVDYFSCRFNGDTASNYSFTWVGGNSGGAQNGRFSNLSQNIIGWATSNADSTGTFALIICDIFNYANTTTFKTSLSRSSLTDARADAQVNLWRKTPEAINSISLATWGAGTFGANNIRAGSTLTLYGVKAA